MSNSYLVIVKTRNLTSMTISKMIMFSNSSNAYEYALNIPMTKEKFNTIEKALETNLVWRSSKNSLPIHECKLIPVDNDILCNIYQTVPDNEKLMTYIYKELFINEIINE